MVHDVDTTMGDLIDNAGIVMIGSVDAEGFPNVKAMLPPRQREGLRTIYFSTNTSSMRVQQFRENEKACLYFFEKARFRGVMLRGTMAILEDAKSKEMIWRDGDTLYYKQGVTDPDYCVLRFTAQTGRYYAEFASERFAVL